MIPWWFVSLVDFIAWPLGYQTYVRAKSDGWGAEKIHFVRRLPGDKRLPKLKAKRQ